MERPCKDDKNRGAWGVGWRGESAIEASRQYKRRRREGYFLVMPFASGRPPGECTHTHTQTNTGTLPPCMSMNYPWNNGSPSY